jgi:hypothetical protein
MPRYYKPQLVEFEVPWLDIWELMEAGLRPHARRILDMLGFYVERDLRIPSARIPLDADEESEFNFILLKLTEAAIENQGISPAVWAATLKKLVESPTVRVDGLPGIIQWELARVYRRADERPGTYAMDIWGNETTEVWSDRKKSTRIIRGDPIPGNVARAAQMLLDRLTVASGRPYNRANELLAEAFGPIFRRSGQPTARKRKATHLIKINQHFYYSYAEDGPYYEFLRLVVSPLNAFLVERGFQVVTVESIVRLTPQPVLTPV